MDRCVLDASGVIRDELLRSPTSTVTQDVLRWMFLVFCLKSLFYCTLSEYRLLGEGTFRWR